MAARFREPLAAGLGALLSLMAACSPADHGALAAAIGGGKAGPAGHAMASVEAGAAAPAAPQSVAQVAAPGVTPVAERNAPTLQPLELAAAESVETGVSGSRSAYEGQAIKGPDGVVRFGEIGCPGHPSETCWLHQVVRGDPKIHGWWRSEITYTAKEYDIVNGQDYWIAFAIRIPETWPLNRKFRDRSLFFQIHQRSDPGDRENTVPLSLIQENDGYLRWKMASSPRRESSDDDTVRTELHKEPLRTGVWIDYIVHYRPAFDPARSPLVEIWRDDHLIAASSQPNAFDNEKPAWPKFGLYKWNEEWTVDRLGFASRGLFFGRGADRLADARAALAWH